MKRKKRILVSPLDWGIGHATRCIPIIRELIKHNFEILLSSSGRSEVLLRKEFPDVQFISLKGYNIKYSKDGRMMIWRMFFQIPKILLGIIQEHKNLKKIIKEYEIDAIISDNRYGMWNSSICSVFISHQIQIKSPLFSNLINQINLFFLKKYTECWVPDCNKNKLSGELSISSESSIKYIGPLSRLKYRETNKEYDICFLISGPEPQRTILEKIATDNLVKWGAKSCIILGKPEEEYVETIGNCKIYSYLNAKELNTILLKSKIVICRSGYSTIMDLDKLKLEAIFIPTPGQKEQEYLAEYLEEQGICFYQNQEDFDLTKSLVKSEKYSGFKNYTKTEIDWNKLFKIFEE